MEYNINDIIDWLKGKASECSDNYSLQRKYFDAVIYLHRLDVVLKRIALEKENVENEETVLETVEENTEKAEVATDATETADNTQVEVTEEESTDADASVEEVEVETIDPTTTEDTDATTEETED